MGMVRKASMALGALMLAAALVGVGSVASTAFSADNGAVRGAGLFAPETAYAATQNGLVKENGFYRYYQNGSVVTSTWKTIGGSRYYFNANGNAICGKAAKISGKWWIFGNTGKLLKPAKKTIYTLTNGKYFVNTSGHPAAKSWFIRNGKLYCATSSGKLLRSTTKDGITFTSTAAAKDNTASQLKMAIMKKLDQLTNSSMTKKQKLRACFSYCVTRKFDNSMEPTDIGKTGWMQRCALKALKENKNECFGTACTFAAFAYELGYDPTVKGVQYMHAFVLIDGKAYDNMYPGFGGTPQPQYANAPTWKFNKWGYPSTSSSQKAATTKTGLVTIDGAKYYVKADGTYLTGAWKTIGDYRYYFKSTGKAAVGPLKLSSGRYVFLESGRLATGTATHTVTVKGKVYRVTAAGVAKPGFNDAKTRYYLVNGEKCCGVRVANDVLYACSADGVYDADLTKQVRAAAGENYCSDFENAKEASELLGLLGEYKSRVEEECCHPEFTMNPGNEVNAKYVYSNGLVIYTHIAPDGTEYIESYN